VAAAAAVAAPAKKQQFCFLHGHQSSHSGQHCRILKSNPALIDAIAKARGPATVGGFTSDSVGGVAISNRKAFKTAYSLN
jgi:glycine/serine hydroxymethyltransferase